MPNVRSAEKRLKQSIKRNLRNRTAKSSIKTILKSTTDSIQSGNKNDAEKSLKFAISKLDTVSGKGIIHKNLAARKKSKLSRLFNKRFS